MAKQAVVDVILNNEVAKARIVELEDRVKSLIALKMKALKDENTPLFDRLKAETKAATQELNKLQKQSYDVDAVLKNISGASINDLRKALSQATLEMNKMNRDGASGYDEQKKKVQSLKGEIDKVNASNSAGESWFGKMSAGVNKYFGLVAMGAAAVYGAARSVGEFLTDWDTAAQSEKKLQTALKGREEIMPNLMKNAAKLQDLMNVPHEVIESQEAFLASQGRTEDQIKKTMKAAIQMAADIPGMDLSGAVKQLDSSYSGVLRGLNRLDPAFKLLTKEQLENGAAVDLINEKYQGFAETAAQEGVGPLKQLGLIWTDIKENMGGMIAKVILPLSSGFKDLFIWIRDLLNPVTKLHAEFLQWVSILVIMFKSMVSLAAGVIAYNVAINLSNIGLALHNFWLGVVKKAQDLWNISVKSNPIGLLVAVLVAAGTALMLFSQRMSESSKLMKEHLKAIEDTAQAVDKEKVKTDLLVESAKNEKLSKEERLKALKELQTEAGGYLKGLTLENIATNEGAKLLGSYNRELEKKIWLEGNQKELAANMEAQRQVQRDRFGIDGKGGTFGTANAAKQAEVDAQKRVTNTTFYSGSADERTGAGLATKGAIENDVTNQQKQNALATTYNQLIAEKNKLETKYNTGVPGKLTPELTDEEKAKAAEKAQKAAEKAAAEKKKQYDVELKVAVDASTDQKNLLEKQHNDSTINDATFHALTLQSDLEFLQKKIEIEKKNGQSTVETQNELDKKILDAEAEKNALILKAQQTLKDAKIENVQNEIDKQIAKEDDAWTKEQDALKEQFIIKGNLTLKEIELNDLLHATIEEKTKAHNERMLALTNAKALEQYDINELSAKSDIERWDAQAAKAKATYDQEIKLAGTDQKKILTAEKKYKDDSLGIQNEKLDKEKELGNAKLDILNNGLGVLVDIFGKESALGKAFFYAQQATAIAQIIFNTAIANSKAVAAFPVTFGQPWVTINTVSAGVSIAGILAQTFGSSKGKKSGGYADEGSDDDVAGYYHKNEFINSADAVRNPTIKPVLDIIDYAQRSGTIRSINLPAVMAATFQRNSPGKKDGGFTSPAGASGSSSIPVIQNSNNAVYLQMLEAFNKLNKQLEKPIRADVSLLGKNGFQEQQDKLARIQKNANIGG